MSSIIPKWMNPFARTQPEPTQEMKSEAIRKFSEPGIAVCGNGPGAGMPDWQVRVPLDRLSFESFNGRRYAIYDKSFCTVWQQGTSQYAVEESPIDHSTAKTLLVEFAPGHFMVGGRYAPSLGLEKSLTTELPRDAMGDPSGTREQMFDRNGEAMAKRLASFVPHDLVLKDEPQKNQEWGLGL